MSFFLAGLCVLVLSGLAAWITRRESVGAAGAVLGPMAGLLAPVQVLYRGETSSCWLPWNVPYGSFSLEVDALAAFFLLLILGVSVLAALYGFEYLKPYRKKRNLGSTWFFYNTLVASMMLVVCAKNGVLFLSAWEAMALASFFLGIFEAERPETLDAGWSYLIASHLGTAFLLVFFIWLGRGNATLDFDGFGPVGPPEASLLFLLAVFGFGTKAGFFPLHVWLPEAHPAAPSHVSALMSGVMIKTGIYGLLRFYMLLGPGPAWWGWLLVVIGAVSGVTGVLFALAQHDLKRLLAYHSVENIGIIALGLGLGMLGRTFNIGSLAALGFAGGLLHVANHALFKSLLFFGAGAVAQASGTRDMEHLGGLIKSMPWTAGLFLLGAAAISGLPPLNGFVSEFLIFLGAYHGASFGPPEIAVPAVAVILSLALIGGLAIACFIKVFGVVFLGASRADHARDAHEAGWPMRLSMLVLAAGCAAIGIGSPWILPALGPVVAAAGGPAAAQALDSYAKPLFSLTFACLALPAAVVLVAALRSWLLTGRPSGRTATWGCGYAHPSARMQYTASSFAQPLTSFFAGVLGVKTRFGSLAGFYPAPAEFATHAPDIARKRLFEPAFEKISGLLMRLRWLQHGHPQLYVLYIAVTLLALFLWKLG